ESQSLQSEFPKYAVWNLRPPSSEFVGGSGHTVRASVPEEWANAVVIAVTAYLIPKLYQTSLL
ncbi:hypothetical protein, partial [Sphingorhabdus sp.]